MAEYLFRKMLKERGLDNIQVASSGTSAFAGIGPSVETVRVLQAEGIDASTHRGRKVDHDILGDSDVIFAMQKIHKDYVLGVYPDAQGRVFILSEFYEGDDRRDFMYGIPDPIGMSNEFYKNVMHVIRRSLEGVIAQIEAGRGGAAK